MRERCSSITSGSFERYGGRGIKVCKRWEKFENFRDDMWESFCLHADIHGVHQTTLDRIDNKQGYSKSNCRWVTYSQQRKNSSTAVIFDGETATEASLRLGGLKTLVYKRLAKGWPVEKAFTTQSRKKYAHK